MHKDSLFCACCVAQFSCSRSYATPSGCTRAGCWHEIYINYKKLTNVWQGGILNGQLQICFPCHVSNPQKNNGTSALNRGNCAKRASGPDREQTKSLKTKEVTSKTSTIALESDSNFRFKFRILRETNCHDACWLQKWSTSASAEIALQVRLVYGAQDKATWKLSGILLVKAQFMLCWHFAVCKNICIHVLRNVLGTSTMASVLPRPCGAHLWLYAKLWRLFGRSCHQNLQTKVESKIMTILHQNFIEFHGFLLVSNMTIQKSRSLPLKGSLWIESYFGRTRKLGRHVSAMWMIPETVHPLRFKRRRCTGSSSICAVFKSAMEMRARHILPSSLLTAKRTTGNLPFAREQ